MRTTERLRILAESVNHLADALDAAVCVTTELDWDRDLFALIADALRLSALFGRGERVSVPKLTAGGGSDLCGEAACMSRGLYEIAGERWCRRHALDTALGSQVLRRSSMPPRLPRPRADD